MREDNLPMRLYRYVSLATQYGRSAVDNAILHHRLWWSSPLSFNDPFDCNPFVIFGESASERRAFAKRVIKTLDRNPRPIKRRNRRYVETFSHTRDRAMLDKMWLGELATSAMVCFSALSDHPLMWAHYADSHRGIVLVFDEQIRPTEWLALPVIYSADRPLVNLARMSEIKTFEDAMLTKSRHWSYEEELRMVSKGERVGFNEFPREALVGIILGAKISEQDNDFILNLAARRQHLRIWRASMHAREYKLDIGEREPS